MGIDIRQANGRDGVRSKVALENSVELKRPPVEVFDYCSDLRNEFEWNPNMRSVELLTPEPVQAGSRYRARWKGGPESIIEYVEFDRPHDWVAISGSSMWRIRFEGRVQETGDGCRLVVRLVVAARGMGGRLLFPVFRRILQRQEQTNMANIRRALEV